jgi:glycosyltransferase involved in cell wall biosynthesis
VARRIQKLYRRDANVIYPPVDMSQFAVVAEKDSYYITASRLVSYKRIDLLIQAFNRMPDRELKIIGDGPEFARLQKMAGPNVQLLGHVSSERLCRHMQKARAFVFAAEEDFGIVPVEAMACGTPVIAYGHGGTTESVTDGETGLFFDQQTAESVIEAVERFENRKIAWDPHLIRRRAQKFSIESFRNSLVRFVDHEWLAFMDRRNGMASATDEAGNGTSSAVLHHTTRNAGARASESLASATLEEALPTAVAATQH